MLNRLLAIFIFGLCLDVAASGISKYSVQVGDVIRISLPGEDSINTTFNVDRSGKIYLPEVGEVEVVGILESDLEEIVREELAPIFQDLINLHAYVYKRQLLVNVLGYVNTPGEAILPASANIQSIIQAAGGLKTGAQLDNLHIRRGNEIIKFNYKSYLDSGDPTLLPQAKSLDMIFVPASPKIGNVEMEFDSSKIADAGDAADKKNAIKVFGEVNSPGSFSFKKNLSIIDLVMRAGGVSRYAGVEQIKIISNGEPILFNLNSYLESGDTSGLPSILPGATIFVPRQVEAIKSGANTIYVMGEVFHPGAYESQKNASFMDIIANAGGPTRYAESRQIRILKSDSSVIRFDLSAFTEGTSTQSIPNIEPGDAIFVPEKTDMNEKSWLKVTPDRAVRVIGEVVRPGRIEWSSEMSLLDLLAHVGGPVSRADTGNIEILTTLPSGETTSVVFDLDEFMKKGLPEDSLPKVYAGATVRVHDLPQDPSDNKSQWVRQASEKSIYIFGQVGAPGRYMFTDKMNFLDILSAADGPTKDADLHNIRINHRNEAHMKMSKLNLALYFETGDEHLLPDIKMGDSIYIPEKNRLWVDQPKDATVRVLGEVHKPGRYRYSDDMTILDLLAEAGGPNSSALITKIAIINMSCCKNKARIFNLKKFSRTAKIKDLPLLREGDTIYIPNRNDGRGEKVRKGLGDIFRIISLTLLLGL
ncbi:MAG: SLBB domain-containing protein [Agarilytica sp.]